jgi:hypothetical protein
MKKLCSGEDDPQRCQSIEINRFADEAFCYPESYLCPVHAGVRLVDM